jgi:tRNA threonylcarbamoyladenosine biosynthesis protein TsaE
MTSRRSWRSRGVEETRRIGRELAVELAPDGALLLVGDLGAGKTVLVQGLAEGLGIDPDRIQSPTYTLLAEHGSGQGGSTVTLRHLDLYRLEPDDVRAAGFEELLLGPGVKAVEWAERLPFDVPGALTLRISGGETTRELEEIERPGTGN